jgi:hypothetical protein
MRVENLGAPAPIEFYSCSTTSLTPGEDTSLSLAEWPGYESMLLFGALFLMVAAYAVILAAIFYDESGHNPAPPRRHRTYRRH